MISGVSIITDRNVFYLTDDRFVIYSGINQNDGAIIVSITRELFDMIVDVAGAIGDLNLCEKIESDEDEK